MKKMFKAGVSLLLTAALTAPSISALAAKGEQELDAEELLEEARDFIDENGGNQNVLQSTDAQPVEADAAADEETEDESGSDDEIWDANVTLDLASEMDLSAASETSGDWTYTVSSASQTATVTNYSGSASKVSIPDQLGGYTVTSIGQGALSGNTTMKNVTIPASVTTIAAQAFYGCTSLTKVTIPENVTQIGSKAFYNCAGLYEIDWNAASVKNFTKSSQVFYNAGTTSGGITLKFGTNVTSIPSYAFYVEDTTYSPVFFEEPSLPYALASIGQYAFANCATITKLTIPRSVDTIGTKAFDGCTDLVIYAYADSYAWDYATDNGITTIGIKGNIVTLNVVDDAGNSVTEGYSVSWSSGSSVLGTGTEIEVNEDIEAVSYIITLDESLAFKYYMPESEVVSVSGDTTVTYTFKEIPTVSLTGTVKDESGNAMPDVGLTFTQTSGSYSRTVTAISGEDGSYSANILNTKTTIAATVDGYYDYSETVIDSTVDNTAIDHDIVMGQLPESKIILSLSLVESAAETEEASITYLTSFSGLNFELYNKTQDKTIYEFVAQYPNIAIGSKYVKAGDVVVISVTDSNGKMEADSVSVTMDELVIGSASIKFRQNGRYRINSIAGADNVSVFAFDSDGIFIKKYSVTTSFFSDAMPDGKYSFVLMKETALMRSVSTFSKLSEYGLRKDKDYLLFEADITHGVITEQTAATVPTLDESRLYYTEEDSTYYVPSVSNTIQGKLVSMKATYKIQDKYSTTNQKLIFDVADGMYFVDNSLTLNGKIATYTKEDDKIIVYTNASEATIRFCALSNKTGKNIWDASLSFDMGDTTYTQPIGSAAITVNDMDMNVPEITGFTNFVINGKTLAKKNVDIYVDNELYGSTTTNSAGRWTFRVDLKKAYTLSYHTVYVEIDTGYGKIVSDEHSFMYDSSYATVSKVTMYNTAHPSNSLTPTEYATVFDFENPSTTTMSYSYWPSYPDFTFTIEIDGSVENVKLLVYTLDGDTNSYDATYDETSGLWIVKTKVTNFYDTPVNVGVEYSTLGEKKGSREEFDDTLASYQELSQSVSMYDEIDTSLDEAFDAYESAGDDDEKLAAYRKYIEAQQEYNGYSNSLDSDVFGDEVEIATDDDNDVHTMSQDELIDYIAEQYETLAEITEDMELTIGDVQSLLDSIKGLIDFSSELQDLEQDYDKSEEELLEDGYESIPLDDNSSLYKKMDEEYIYVVDLNNKRCVKASRESGTIVNPDLTEKDKSMLAKLENLREQLEAVDTSGGTDPVAKMEALLSICDIDIIELLNEFKDNLDTTAEKFEKIKEELLRESSNLRDRYKNLVQTQKSIAEATGKLDDDAAKLMANTHDDIIKRAKIVTKTFTTCKIAIKVLKTVSKWLDKLIGKVAIAVTGLKDMISYAIRITKLYNRLPADCPGDPDGLDIIETHLKSETVRWILYFVTSCLAIAADAALETASGATATPVVIGLLIAEITGLSALDEMFDTALNSISREIDKLDCKVEGTPKPDDDDDNDENNKNKSPNNDVIPIADPSGYVYEAVPSNRLEGVTATVYFEETLYDEFGDPTGEKQTTLWDAEEYDQENPLITDTYGSYYWDVPTGNWLVTYTKDGYEDLTSANAADAVDGWLPVPPPQTEVNVGMVSKASPEVKDIAAYSESIRLEFSQYMNIASVNTNTVSVTSNGEKVAGTVTPVNAEYNYDNTAQYASIFTFTPDEVMDGEIDIGVSGVLSYNGKLIAQAYKTEQTVTAEPKGLEVQAETAVEYSSGALVTLSVTPAAAGANRTIRATSSSPSVVSVVNPEVTTDSDGKANIMLSGNLPGSGTITFTVDGTDITAQTTATVGDIPADTTLKCSKVKANIASGSTVSYGTKIELTTDTEDAQIYYTLDGTCPCTVDSPSRLKYTEPLTVTDDMFIIAYAVLDGYDDSSTAGFLYFMDEAGSTGAYTIGDVQTTSDGIVVDVTKNSDVSAVAIGVTYDASGSAVDTVFTSLDGTAVLGEETEVTIPADTTGASHARVFIWDSLSGMRPLAVSGSTRQTAR